MSEQIMLDDDMEIDYSTFYNPTTPSGNSGNGGNKKPADTKAGPTRTGQVLNMMNKYNHGTTMICIIPDRVLTVVEEGKPGVPRLFRKVQYGYSGRIATSDNPKLFMNIQIPRVQDFTCELTEEQKGIINKLRTQCKNFSQFVSYQNRGKFVAIQNLLKSLDCPPQTVYCYGKLVKMISKDKGEIKSPEIGHVRVFKFDKGELGKSDFITVLNASINNKINALGSPAWMKDYFNRTAGTRSKVVSVNIDQSTGAIKKYMINTSLEEIAPFEVTEDELKIADNLNSRVFDITKFDTDYYTRLSAAFDNVQKVVDSLSK